MQILVCAATELEIAPTLQTFSNKAERSIQFLITGVGMLATAYSLTKKLTSDPPELIIQAGVAGSLLDTEPLGKVVTVQSECLGDTGVYENGNFRSLFDLHLLSSSMAPWKKEKLYNNSAALTDSGLPVVNGVTVSQISTDNKMIDYYRSHLDVQVESMEGAALHYIALQEKIPFLQIRSLSNFIGERDKAKWKLKEAVANLNSELQRLLAKWS